MSFLAQLKARILPLDKKTSLLDTSKWCRDFTWPQMEMLATYLEVYEAPRNSYVFKEGSTEAFMVILVEGGITILKEDSEEMKQTLSEVAPGKTIGEMSLMDGAPRSASALASKQSTLLVLTKRQFLLLIEEKPQLAVQVLLIIVKLMSLRLRQTSGKLVEHLGGKE